MSAPYLDLTAPNALAAQNPYAYGKPRRYLVSHCAGCREPQYKPYFVAVYASEERQHAVIYTLCRDCAGLLKQRNKKARSRFVGRIERNLEALGRTLKCNQGVRRERYP